MLEGRMLYDKAFLHNDFGKTYEWKHEDKTRHCNVVEKLLVNGEEGGVKKRKRKMTMIKEVLERKTLERQKGGGYDEESRQ